MLDDQALAVEDDASSLVENGYFTDKATFYHEQALKAY